MELEHLISVFGGDPPGSDPEFAFEYAKQIYEFFKNPLDLSKLDQYLGLAFPEDDGLIAYLRNTITNKKYNGSKEQILNTIKLILSRKDVTWNQTVLPFCRGFKTVANLYWKSKGEPAKHQQIALDCLIALLENYADRLDESDLEFASLYWELLPASEKSTYQPSVRGKMFHLLGLVASRLNNSLFNRPEVFSQFFKHIVNTVKIQVESKDAHLQVAILLGSLKAMDRILNVFGSEVIQNDDDWKSFYINLEQIVDPRCSIASEGKGQVQVKRREFQRAGLELVANNANHFGKDLYHNYEQWYKDLIVWSKSNNLDDNSVGRRAMYTFLEAVAEYTKSEAEEMQTDSHDNFVSYFLQTFQQILNTQNVSRSELLIAIKGVGLLSSSCSNNPEKVKEIFHKIMELISDIVVELNSPVTDKYSGSLSIVSAYLESVGSILPHIEMSTDEADSKFLSNLNTIEQLSVQLMSFYPDLSDRIRVNAHVSVFKIAEGLRVKHNQLCIPFVDRIINLALSHVISSPTQAELDILMESWNKTNKGNSQSKKSATSQLGLRGVKSYTSFWINLASRDSGPTVELLYDSIIQWTLSTIAKLDLTLVLEMENDQNEIGSGGDITSTLAANVLKDFHLFVNLVEFFQIFIPKTSGQLFEKWVDVLITEMLFMVEQHPLVSGFYKILSVTLNMTRDLQYFKKDNIERGTLFQKCNAFMKNMTNKISEFRDDLLLAVLELWLSSPDEIIIQNFSSLTVTLKIIFGMGRTCFGLAESCIEAINRWIVMEEFPREEIEKLVLSIFPVWQTYFVSTGKESQYLQERAHKKVKSNTKSKSKQQEKKLKLIHEELDEATLKKVQLKLLHLIGSFGHMLDFDHDSASQNVLAEGDRFLKYAVPFQDIKPDIYLDGLLPRILELCENSAERQIRTSACEMLHTFVLYFLGYACRSSGSSESTELFTKMFRTIMKLGCDGDVLVRQLFNPLTIQSVHWFTKPNNTYGETTLRIIVDGLVQSENAPLRDFSAACLSEFFNWALKHDNRGKSTSVLRFIEALSTHAAPQYRLGAVVGFNSMYREFRLNKDLCSKYTITLLVSFVTSLALSFEFENDSMLIKTTKLAISHLERIMIKYKETFNIVISGRKKPAEFLPEVPCLKEVVEWLFVQVGRKEVLCREESVRLLQVLAPLVRNVGSLQSFLIAFEASSGNEKFMELAEREASPGSSLNGICELLFLDAASQFYSLLGDNGLLSSSILSNEKSVFLSSYKRLLQKSANDACEKDWKTITRILCRYRHFSTFFDETVEEQFLKFSILLSQLSFDYDLTTELVNIWNTCQLTSNSRNISKSIIQLNVEEQIEQKANSEVLRNIQWLTIVAENQFLQKLFSNNDLNSLSTAIWNVIDKNLYRPNSTGGIQTVTISKTRGAVLEWLLQLFLALEKDRTKVLDALFDRGIVDVRTSFLQTTTKGDIFLQVMLQVLLRCEEMLNFSDLIKQCKIEKVGTIVEGFLSTLQRNRTLKREMGSKVFESVIRSWSLLSVNCDRHTVARILSGLASLDIQACRDSQILTEWWCGRELMLGRHLDLKEKSEFIGFLGLFALSKQPNIPLQVIDAVEKLALLDFSSNMIWNEEKGYITKIILQILSVYEKLPKQWKLLEVLILLVSKSASISVQDSNVPVFNEVKRRLVKIVKSFVEKNEQVEQTKICSCIYDTILKYTDCRQNMTACKLCLIPAVAAVSPPAARNFYREHLFGVIDKANSSQTTIEALLSKTIAFNLMEMLAHNAGPEFIKSPELLHLYQTKLRNEGVAIPDNNLNAVLKAVISACINFKKTVMPPTSDESMRMTILQCNYASYNAVAANLMATSSSIKILEGILIHEDRLKHNFLWENIVDPKMVYNFPVLLDDKIGENSISFSRIQKESAKSDFNTNPQQQMEMNNRMNLAESSLANEATNYDFTAAVTISNIDYYQRIFGAEPQRKQREQESSIPDVTIEWNEINKHDCMLAFVATIKKLTSISTSSELCPAWVTYIQKVLKSSQHINIKIFILGAFLNCQEIMSHYASYLIDPILSLIIDPTERYFGAENLNYFVKDLIVMLLSWHTTAVPTEDLKRELLAYVVRNVDAQESSTGRQDVFKHNLDIIGKVIEYWSMDTDTTFIPSEIIMDMIRNANPKTGLAVCKQILLAGKLPIPDVFKQMNEFCRALKNSSKPVYCVAAENIGLLLKHLKDVDFLDLEKATEYVKNKINAEKVTRPSAFLMILMELRKHSPSEIIHFKLAIMEFLNTSTLRTEVISLLPTCLNQEMEVSQNPDKKEAAANFFADLEGRRLFQVPCATITEAETGLEILEILTMYMDDTKKLMKILEWVKILEAGDENGKLRSRYAKCILKVYKMLTVTETQRYTVAEKSLLRVFVRLFGDQDPDVKEVVNEFWSSSLEKWSETPMLILELMEIVGDQDHAIEITLGLIMKRCSLSPDFCKDIFDKPLEDCTFFNYDLDTSWRMRHASFQPLFAESLSSSQNFSTLPTAMQNSIISQRRSVGKFGVNLLRATLSLANQRFTPTQQQVSSAEPMEINDGDFQFLSQNEGLSISTEGSQSQPPSQNDPLASLRKRFYHRPDSGFFARKEVERQKGLVAATVEAVKMKRNNVKLTRSYRVGELPDILIKHSDLLKTMSTLAKLDDEIGRSFLVILFTSMLKGLDRQPSDQQKYKNTHYKNRAQEVFESLLTNYGRMLKPNFAAAILEISILNDIPIRPGLVSDVCIHLDLHELGILELEKYVIEGAGAFTHFSSKRARLELSLSVTESDDFYTWLRIAEFYKDLEEYDVLRNIFSIGASQSGVSGAVYDESRAALSLEAVGKVEAALEKYSELYREYRDSSTLAGKYNFAVGKFLEDAVLNCLASLSSWEQLYDETEQCKERIYGDQIFENIEFVGRILPLAVKSGLQILFEESEDVEHATKYKSFMLESGEDVLKFLNGQYPIEMAVLMLSDDFQNTAKSSTLLEKGWDMGVKEFQLFSRLSLPQRRQRTLMLQQASVVQDILTWSKGFNSNNVEQKTKTLCVKSERSCNYGMASLVNSDMVVAERAYFLGKIIEHKSLETKTEIIQILKGLNFRQHMWVLSLGLRDRNLTVSNKYLEKSQELGDDMSENERLEWKKMYINYLSTFHDHIPTDEWIKMWSSAWNKIDRHNNTLQLDSSGAFQMQGELLRCLIEATLGQEHLANAKSTTRINKSLLGKSTSQGSFTIMAAAMQRSTDLIERLSNHNFENSSKADQAYIEIFNLLKLLLKSFPKKYGEDDNFMKLLLNCLLRSMESDKAERLLLFPSILPLLEKFPSLHSTFSDTVKNVPTWIFLPWLDQIVTSFRTSDSSLQSVYFPVLKRLKETYPQAFQLQYTDLLPTDSSNSSCIQETYSKSLKALVLPVILNKKFMDELERCISRKNIVGAKKILIEFRNMLKTYDDSDIYGKLHKEYAAEMTNAIETVLEQLTATDETGERNNSESPSQTNSVPNDSTTNLIPMMSNLKKYHQQKVKEMTSLKGTPKDIELKDLSPWLAKFHHSISKEEIEIPGLYDGLCKPDVAFHPKIVAFEPMVAVYASLTKPIKYTMVGNNGKKVNFLAKHGDDLRQDRRIQQLLRVSNKLFDQDCKTQKRKLSIMTYSVMPMTEAFGVVQWVDQTVSLATFICNSEALKALRIKSVMAHGKWISDTSGLDSTYSQYYRYLNSAKKATRLEAEREFDLVASGIPRKLLNDHVQERSRSLEEFFKNRQGMVRSYAAMCIVHWLLGIGDRHLENCMVSLETGHLVGIDFGRAFGAGNTILEIPEMIPFRLTPQLQSLMSPYGCKGLFKETMLYGWRCLINSSELLLSIIDIFVNERRIDWLKQRKGHQDARRNRKWQPMLVIEKKLKCKNPVMILLEEIENNTTQQKDLIPVYSAVVTDGREDLLKTEQFTDEEVVDALIDMATDKNILSRHFQGLCSWI